MGKSYLYSLEEKKLKAHPLYALCASTSEEGYVGRRYARGAVKLKADNTVMATTGVEWPRSSNSGLTIAKRNIRSGVIQ